MNLKIYDAVRTVPKTALREIQAGRLRGKSDINPMWRIKALTEQFGPCGIGWKYIITDKRLEKGGKDEIAAFVDINLHIKQDGEWSEAIPGTGGSMFVANEKNGPYVSDECFKMALTDAISVACKALGVGADVYWEADKTKYTQTLQNATQGNKTSGNVNGQPETNQGSKWQIGTLDKAEMLKLAKEKNVDMKAKGKEWTGKDSSSQWTEADFKKVMEELRK